MGISIGMKWSFQFLGEERRCIAINLSNIEERRKKPDIICYWLQFAVFIIWIAIFAFLALLNAASVREETFFDRLLKV